MTTLFISESGEVRLTLRGEVENRILATVRRWPHWRRVDIERDPVDAGRCLSVTLVADMEFEPTLREILKRSFNLTFPETGGSSALDADVLIPARKARRR